MEKSVSSQAQIVTLRPPDAAQDEVLQNFDLLEVIFSLLEIESGVSSKNWALSIRTRRHLLNAALTCKAFFDPAMNVLWKSMDSLAPLVKVLPTFVMILDEYTVNEVILDSHLYRVDQYARRIRRLRLNLLHNSRRPIPSFIYHLLTSLRPHGLIPTLTHLFIPSIAPKSGIDSSCLDLLAFSSLTALEIYSITNKNEDLAAHFLKSYSQKAPAIKHLALSRRITHSTLDSIINFRQLNHLVLNIPSNRSLEADFLQKCTEIMNLSSLMLLLSKSMELFPLGKESIGDVIEFPRLSKLALVGSTPNIGGVLQRVYVPCLKSIILEVEGRMNSISQETLDKYDLRTFMQLLIETGRIESVSISLIVGLNSMETWAVFKPLVSHASGYIRSLDLLLSPSYLFPPFAEFCLTLHWPALEFLQFYSGGGGWARLNPPPKDLPERFALVCPKLKSFRIR